MKVKCGYSHGHFKLYQRSCSRPIIKIWCLSDPLEFPMEPFSSGWITSVSANCCYCFKFIQNQHWDAGAQVCVCFCGGGVPRPKKGRSYFTCYAYFDFAYFVYFAYYFTVLVHIVLHIVLHTLHIFIHIILHVLHIILHIFLHILHIVKQFTIVPFGRSLFVAIIIWFPIPGPSCWRTTTYNNHWCPLFYDCDRQPRENQLTLFACWTV
jgi:hypothetical protein